MTHHQMNFVLDLLLGRQNRVDLTISRPRQISLNSVFDERIAKRKKEYK